jgi:hypothetical protein
VPSGPVTLPDLRGGVSVSDRDRPLITGANGTLMARQTVVRPALMARPMLSIAVDGAGRVSWTSSGQQMFDPG